MPLRFVKTWNDIARIAIAKNIRFMDHIDKTLLERMSYGGMIAEDRSKERLDRLSERIIFEVGDTRFAIQWTAEIEQLPPAGPVAIRTKTAAKLARAPHVRR